MTALFKHKRGRILNRVLVRKEENQGLKKIKDPEGFN
jgi:hypothetical protein